MIIRETVKDSETIEFLEKMNFFENMNEEEKENLLKNITIREYEKGETANSDGDTIDFAGLVIKGEFIHEFYERISLVYEEGEIFGSFGIFTKQIPKSLVKTFTGGKIVCFNYDLFKKPEILGKAQMFNLFMKFQPYLTDLKTEQKGFFNYMDVLIIQDGGCAPGKNSVIAFLTEYLEKAGRKVYIASEGYRSVVNGMKNDFKCLVDDRKIYHELDSIPGVVNARRLRDARGADFRSERFPEFNEIELQQQAAKNIISRNVKTLIGVGGNGTFGGLSHLIRHLPESIQVFYIPVTIDSDVLGSDTIGQYTGVEVGAEKFRCYLADAATHHRCYIIEMMGAMGGYHALNSAVGAGAHLAVLPGHTYNLHAINKALEKMDNAVIVVAEGYKKQERKASHYEGNAATYFRDELIQAGLKTKMKIFCEPFSRDIRGATPNNMDIALAQAMAKRVAEMSSEGKSRLMPSIKGSEHGADIPFSEIQTNNSVDANLVKLANRLY